MKYYIENWLKNVFIFYIFDVSNSFLHIVKKNYLIVRDSWITHIIYITHIVSITHVTCITYIMYIIHTVCITGIFKAYRKRTDKIVFQNFFFLYIKIIDNYYKKTQIKAFKKGYWKVTKPFWWRNRQKALICPLVIITIFLKKIKKRSVIIAILLMRIEKSFLECTKEIHFYYIYPRISPWSNKMFYNIKKTFQETI